MREEADFMSSIFTREKRDGSFRMIRNSKQPNKHIEYEHFKMEALESVSNIIRPNCWMAIKSFSNLDGKRTAIHLG